MYDHEYEWDILGFLRMLKYVWQRDKDILSELRGFCRCAEIDVNDIFELSFVLLTEYICVDMPDDDSDDPYGDEFTRFILSEPELDEYEEHVGGQLSKESFTEKRESLFRAQNEKKRQLARLESDWELLSAEEETAKKEEQQTFALSPYHEIIALDPALMRELVCEILVFHRQKIQINWKFTDFTSEFVE